MIKVWMDEDAALGALMERVEYWTDDFEVKELFKSMYESYVYAGVFDDIEFDVMNIVDNDYVNNTKIIWKGDDEYAEIEKIFENNGLCDCSCETEICDYIEAKSDNAFLVR